MTLICERSIDKKIEGIENKKIKTTVEKNTKGSITFLKYHLQL